MTISKQELDPSGLPATVMSAINAILEKKGEEVIIFDVREFTPFMDFNILTTAGSAIQAKVLMETVVEDVKKAGLSVRSVEGDPDSGWILMDFWDIVVHIFRPELRRYYNLDGLWADMPSVKFNAGNIGP